MAPSTVTVSQSELARRLGLTRQAVSIAVRKGRISVGDDGRIDPVKAAAEWARNTRQSITTPTPQLVLSPTANESCPPAKKTARAPMRKGAREVRTEVPSPPPPAASDPPAPPTPNPYTDARTRIAIAQAKREEHELEVALGQAVAKEDVARAEFAAGRALRDRVLAVPARLAGELVGLDDVREVRRRLDSALREALSPTLADVRRLDPGAQ